MGAKRPPSQPVNNALEVQLAAELGPEEPPYPEEQEEVDIDREIFFNESTYGKKRLAVSPQAAVSLLQSSNLALEEAVQARQRASKRGVSASELLPEEATFLEVVSNAICLLRKSNYVVQKDLHYIKTRSKESKMAQNEIRRIIEKSIRDKDVVIQGLKEELRELEERRSEWDQLPEGRQPEDRIRTLQRLMDRLEHLKEITAHCKDRLLESKKTLFLGDLTSSL